MQWFYYMDMYHSYIIHGGGQGDISSASRCRAETLSQNTASREIEQLGHCSHQYQNTA